MRRNHAFSSQDLLQLRFSIESAGADTALETLIAVAHDVKLDQPIAAIVQGDHDYLGHVIAGGILRFQASIARGAMVAAMTSSRRFQQYADILDAAAFHIGRALALKPADGLASGLYASFALEKSPEGKAEAERRLVASDRAPASSYCDILQSWSYKWGGSQAQMWDCLNRLYRPAPHGWAMVARAHWEQRLYQQLFAPESATNYRSPQTESLWPPLTETSQAALDWPGEIDNPGLGRFVHGWFGRLLWEMGDHRRAKHHLVRVGRHIDPTIWIYGSVLLNAQQRFKLARLRVGLLP